MHAERVQPFRLGFAVKVVGEPLKEADKRRWQSGPHLRTSVGQLLAVFAYLERIGVSVYRMSSSVVPYGTHPDLPEFDYRRQLEDARDEIEALAAEVQRLALRLSLHPGQYTVLNAPDDGVRDRSVAEVQGAATLLDALRCGPEAVVVVHVGGRYGDPRAAMDRWSRAWELLGDAARRRLALENDERLFHLGDVLELHRRTGVKVVYDHHHGRINPAPGLEAIADALRAAFATWPDGVRPKVHLSSPRLVVDEGPSSRGGRKRWRFPALAQHADLVSPWDLRDLVTAAPAPLDVMLEAKAKDLAVIWLRRQLAALAPGIAEAEEVRARRGGG